ncbi:MAG: hypothetical protein GXX84_11675 [Acidobacteria bacterium]|nr:hypothetical protein [Acidobacteriota bacterium]
MSRTQAGFSLTELVIVTACTATLLCAAVPNIHHLNKAWLLWGEVRSLEQSLQWGKMHAISANTPMLFEVDTEQQRYCWTDPVTGRSYLESERRLARGVEITSCPKRPLRFYQHGNAAPAGTYRIEGMAGSYSVIVSPGGRIRIQKNS